MKEAAILVSNSFHFFQRYLWGIKDDWCWHTETASLDQVIPETAKWQLYLAVHLNPGKMLMKLCLGFRRLIWIYCVYIWIIKERGGLCEVYRKWHFWKVKLAFPWLYFLCGMKLTRNIQCSVLYLKVSINFFAKRKMLKNFHLPQWV